MSEDGVRKSRILIVEDEPFIALTLEDMLDELGFAHAGTVSQVSEALAFIERDTVDCALLDVNLGSEKIDPVADLLAARKLPIHFHDRLRPLGYPGLARRAACSSKAVSDGRSRHNPARSRLERRLNQLGSCLGIMRQHGCILDVRLGF